MTKGKLRNKIGLLIKAMDGRVTDHHRFLLKMHIEHIESLSSQIGELGEEIYRKLEPYEKEFRLIRTHPAISEVTCASVIAEIELTCPNFRTSAISPHGQPYVREIMKVPER